MNEETKRSNGRGLFIILILLLLGLNGWLFFNAYKNKEDQKAFAIQVSEKDSLINKLNAEYVALQLDLQSQKGISAEMDSVIAQLQNDLTIKKDEITTLLQSKNFVDKKYAEIEKLLADAKNQIASLETDKKTYTAKIDSINAAYNYLMGEYDELEIEFSNQVVRNETLSKEKDSIFELGRIIIADNISVTGVRSKNSGKELAGQKAKKADRLKVCFDLMKNKLSAGTTQTVYVKILGPDRSTLYDEASGSGEFENRENGNDSHYTTAVNVDYRGDESQSYCIYWDQANGYPSGDYEVMVFHQGYCVGKNGFRLK
ncbi:MAG: hypothetical protein H7Y00_01170 [Fimbriimonadaceae bacterium]|nr:hypothetical protein [Chitinophagales bacterium]